MPSHIKPTSVYVDGAKIANVSSGNMSFTNDSEEVIVDGGWIGGTDGAVHGKVSLQTVIVVGGAASLEKLDTLCLTNGYCKVKFQRGSKSYTVDAKVTSFSGEWKHQGGGHTGSVEMICGKPTRS